MLCSTCLSSLDQQEFIEFMDLFEPPSGGNAGGRVGRRGQGRVLSIGPNSPFPLPHAQGTPASQQAWLWRTGKLHPKRPEIFRGISDSCSKCQLQ